MTLKLLLYDSLDGLTRHRGIKRRIDSELIRFPARWSRYYESDYEPETFSFLRNHLKAGDTYLDIGGHMGLFAVVASRIVGKSGSVFTFEPTPFTRSILERVVQINECAGNVQVQPEAMSSQSGETVFFDTGDEASNANSLVRTPRSKVEIPVKLVSIDDFVADRELEVNAIKIDVEGAECDVLRGGQETFYSQRPFVRLGLHPNFILQNGQSLDDIWSVIQEYGYNVLFEDKRVTQDWFCSQCDLFDVNLIPR